MAEVFDSDLHDHLRELDRDNGEEEREDDREEEYREIELEKRYEQ